MIRYRKIGGIHWLAIGRLRVSFCVTKPKLYRPLPTAMSYTELKEYNALMARQNAQELHTWVPDERNHFIF